MSDAIVRFDGISKHFGGVQALDDVTFDIRPAEIHGLAGSNGAGKSTLIRICGGVYHADRGQLIFDGRPVRFRSPFDARSAGIGIVHQEIPICPHLTVTENVMLGSPLLSSGRIVDWRTARRQVEQLFQRLQVWVPPDAVAGRLPIAQQQIVAIAQALALNARMLIADEPTSALNKRETEHLFEIVRQLKAEGITVVYVTHRMEELFELADRITVLRDGKYVGTVDKCDSSPDQVVQMMVGRRIDNLFPKQDNRRSNVLLRVEGLSKPNAFQDISFDLHEGEILGLIGLQGSGVSELLRALYQTPPNLHGRILLRGQPVRFASTLDAIEQGVAYVPANRQADGLFGKMSVRENAGLLLLPTLQRAFGWVSPRALDRATVRMVEDFSIRTASTQSPIGSLSGGNQQKVLIARCISVKPTVVVLDDPTRGIDVGAKAEVHHLLNRLTAAGCGVLLASSEMPEVLAMSDRAIVMYRGRIRAVLSRDQLDHELVMALATGADNAALVEH
jgi:ABC-type sugar transport system ATPase subunit